MARSTAVCAGAFALVLSTAALGPAGAVHADEEPAFPAGTACEFAVDVAADGGNQQVHEQTFADGTVRTISAGTGSALVLTNVSTGKQVRLASNGVASRMTVTEQGRQTLELMGHTVLVLFPTDVPAGPSTQLIVGRAVVDIDATGVWTLQKVAGRQIDLCVALT